MAKKLDMKEVKIALHRKVAQTYEPVKPEMQLGFVHNNVDCIGCRAARSPARTRTAWRRDRASAASCTSRAAITPTCSPTR